MNKKVAFKTLGCRLNQYETDALASKFDKTGYDIVGFHEKADVYIINTCTVTNQSDHKSRNIISQATRKTDDAVVVVTGCMATNQKKDIEKRGGVTYIVANEQKTSVHSIVESHFNGEIIEPDNYEKDLFGFPIGEKTSKVRSLVKIQDGCDNFCTFCIIPFVRGRASSRPVSEILDNIRKLIKIGFTEIVLTGVNIGRYQFESTNFEDLVEQILNLEGDFRVRISSIEPEGFGEKLFSLLNHPKLAPHMHICLQSGSEKVLLKMRRMYTARGFQEMMEEIRKYRPDMNLTTDIIVGFPGEKVEDFQDSLDMMREIKFTHVHTFKYSERDGTRAVRYDDQIPEKVKNERSEVVRLLSEDLKREYRSSFIGKLQTVIIEKSETEFSSGYGEHYIPVKINNETLPKNSVEEVKIIGIEDGEDPWLIGVLNNNR